MKKNEEKGKGNEGGGGGGRGRSKSVERLPRKTLTLRATKPPIKCQTNED